MKLDEYIVVYLYQGERYQVEIQAEDQADCVARLDALARTGQVVGMTEARFVADRHLIAKIFKKEDKPHGTGEK